MHAKDKKITTARSSQFQLRASATSACSTGSGAGYKWRVRTACCHACDKSHAAPVCLRNERSTPTTALMVSA